MKIEYVETGRYLTTSNMRPDDTPEVKVLADMVDHLMMASSHPQVQMGSPAIGQFLQHLGSSALTAYNKIQEERLQLLRCNRGPVAERLREDYRVTMLRKALMEQPNWLYDDPAPEPFIDACTPKEVSACANYQEEVRDLIPSIEHGSNGLWNLFSLRSDKWDSVQELREDIKHFYRADRQGSFAETAVSFSHSRTHRKYINVTSAHGRVSLFNALENVMYDGSGHNLPAGVYRAAAVKWLTAIGADADVISAQKIDPVNWGDEFADIAQSLRQILEREAEQKAKAIEDTFERGFERCISSVMYEMTAEFVKLWPTPHDTFEVTHFKCWLQHPFDDPKEMAVLRYQITLHAQGNEYVISGLDLNSPRISYKSDYDRTQIDHFNPGGYYERQPTQRAYHFIRELMSTLLVARENASQTCYNRYLKWVEAEVLDRQERAARGEEMPSSERRA